MGCSGRVEVFRAFSRLALSDPYQLPVLGWGSRIGEVERRDVDVASRYQLLFGPRPSGWVLTQHVPKSTVSQYLCVWNRGCEESRRTRRAAFGVRNF